MSSFTASGNSRKRGAGEVGPSSSSSTAARSPNKRGGAGGPGSSARKQVGEESLEDLVFEDPFEDEWGSSSEDDEGKGVGKNAGADVGADDVVMQEGSSSASVAMSSAGTDAKSSASAPAIWRGNPDDLAEGEELDFDESTYITYHAMRTQWPCLSFDIIRDRLGSGRKKFPLTTYLVAGTQADRPDKNEVLVMKMGDLHKTQNKSRDEETDEGFNMDSDVEEDDVDSDPYLLTQSVPHNGGVNRIRSMPQAPHVVATWSETASVHVWNLEQKLAALEGAVGFSSSSVKSSDGKHGGATDTNAPAYTYTGHSDEGYAMAWSHVKAGRMVTGDCRNGIFLWDAAGSSGAATFNVDAVPFVGHQGSVEDLQWSWTESNVFASCSADRSVRIFDTRRHASSMLAVEGAHSEDVNVISWNPLVGFLLASGSDDGSFKIWDLRKFERDSPVAHFKFHRAPITSIEWSSSEDSVIATASADHTCIVWDMSLEVSVFLVPCLKSCQRCELLSNSLCFMGLLESLIFGFFF